jgi:hypothetical protein
MSKHWAELGVALRSVDNQRNFFEVLVLPYRSRLTRAVMCLVMLSQALHAQV